MSDLESTPLVDDVHGIHEGSKSRFAHLGLYRSELRSIHIRHVFDELIEEVLLSRGEHPCAGLIGTGGEEQRARARHHCGEHLVPESLPIGFPGVVEIAVDIRLVGGDRWEDRSDGAS